MPCGDATSTWPSACGSARYSGAYRTRTGNRRRPSMVVVSAVSPIAVSMTCWMSPTLIAVTSRGGRGRSRCSGTGRSSPARDRRCWRRAPAHHIATRGARPLRATARSVPKTFTPTSDRTPVVSMSIRLMIGIVQMFDTPGICTARPISARSRSSVMPGTPLVARLQVHDGLGHVQRRGIGRGVGPRDFRDGVLALQETSSAPRSASRRSSCSPRARCSGRRSA